MSKKSFFVILVLSVIMTYGAALVDFALNISTGDVGLPLGFASVNLLGSDTNYTNLILDAGFWFIVVFIIWKAVTNVLKK